MGDFLTDEDRRDARKAGFWTAKWIIAAIVFVLVIGGILWAVGVGTSPVKGKGDAFKQKNQATNMISAQERFEAMYADIKSADQRIGVFTDAVKTAPTQVNQTNLTGATTFCLTAVNDYNAEARKYTAKDFRSTDLPESISDTDPATDCKAGS